MILDYVHQRLPDRSPLHMANLTTTQLLLRLAHSKLLASLDHLTAGLLHISSLLEMPTAISYSYYCMTHRTLARSTHAQNVF